jgi:hypothetical protein
MNKPVMLDSGPLGRIAHPEPNPEIDARKRGKPTADLKELDGDVILAAQALQVDAIVATENVGHLSLFVEAKHWKDIVITP